MIAIDNVQAGDTLVWMGKCGEIFGKVRRIDNGMLVAFTDDVHGFPIELLCCSSGARLIKGDGGRTHDKAQAAPVQAFHTIDDAPVLF